MARVRAILAAALAVACSVGVSVARAAQPFDQPMISFTFDDSILSQATNAGAALKAHGVHGTYFLITMDLPEDGYITSHVARQLAADGHEIASHTVSHEHLTTLTDDDLTYQVSQSQSDLVSQVGVADVTSIASPFGEYDDRTLNEMRQFYTAHRTIDAHYNYADTEHFHLGAWSCNSRTTVSAITSLIDGAVASRGWLILYFHGVPDSTTVTGSDFPLSSLNTILDYVLARGVRVVTVKEGLALMNPPGPPGPPAVIGPEWSAVSVWLEPTTPVASRDAQHMTEVYGVSAVGHNLWNAMTANPSGTWEVTTVARADQRNAIYLQLKDAAEGRGASFDLSTGTVKPYSLYGTGATASIESLGDGWFRCTLRVVDPFAPTAAAVGLLAPGSSYVGDGTSGVYLAEARVYQVLSPPTVSQVAPTSGRAAGGTAVTVTGTGFGDGATVWFGGAAGTVQGAISATTVTVLTPQHATGPVDVTLRNTDRQSATLSGGFTYMANAAPTIATIFPAEGPTLGGTTLTITGTGFLAGATVAIGGAAPVSVNRVSETQLTAVTAAHAPGPVTVTVTNYDGLSTSPSGGFTYVGPPAPTAVSPASGPASGGTSVTIDGSGFIDGLTVTIGGSPAAVTSFSTTRVVATAPPHAAGTVDITVANPDGQSGTLAGAFTYVPPPTITSITPTSGSSLGGKKVTINGRAFQRNAAVSFGDAPAPLTTFVSPTQLTATAPAHTAGVVAVTVTNPDGQYGSLTGAFTYVAAATPTITSFSPTSGPTAGGTRLTIKGSGFAAGATVTIGGVPAPVSSLGGKSITCTTPPASAEGAATVVVTNPDGQAATAAATFQYVSATTLPAPTGLTATAGRRLVSLSWQAVPGATSYSVERQPPGGTFIVIGAPVTTSYTDRAVTAGVTYTYQVRAVNSTSTSAPSATASATPR